ncbi:MAG: hypothetical protein WC469_04090 [Candidatus Omnitrophota bacterium]|jgi:hypothetical protein
MDKKDIYNHLARIYLDASSETSKKSRKKFHYVGILWGVAAAVFLSSLALFSYIRTPRVNDTYGRVELVLLADAAKINFNFNPAKKEIYTIDLNKLNLKRFSALAFSLKKSNIHNNVSVRVEFTNSFKETSEVYVKNVPYRWHDYRIELSDFKSIGNWRNMRTLSFAVEEWNSRESNGVVYVDNIRLLR